MGGCNPAAADVNSDYSLNTNTASQHELKSYPIWVFSQGPHAFNLSWFRSQPMLEYSVEQDVRPPMIKMLMWLMCVRFYQLGRDSTCIHVTTAREETNW